MTVGKEHVTKKYIRLRIREPSMFKRGSFRTHDIGKPGRSKRIAGKLKSGNWATQSILIGRNEPPHTKMKLRKSAKDLICRSKGIYKRKSR